jgi:dihydrofolate reductase
MREISVVNFVTLDGVIQSPADPNEDREGGFDHGGWVHPYLGEEWGDMAAEGMAGTDAFLWGRKTYEKMEAHWPNQPEDDPVASLMNRSTKYVVSTTLKNLKWENSELIKDDVVGTIKKIKEGPGKNLTVLGSGELLQTLIEHDLVDSYRLLLCPVVLGSGKRLFKDGAAKTPLRLIDSTTTKTGAIILSYEPETKGAGT